MREGRERRQGPHPKRKGRKEKQGRTRSEGQAIQAAAACPAAWLGQAYGGAVGAGQSWLPGHTDALRSLLSQSSLFGAWWFCQTSSSAERASALLQRAKQPTTDSLCLLPK